MTTSSPDLATSPVRSVRVSETALVFDLEDGRSVSAPLDWFPRLREGSASERGNWELIGAGFGVYWPDLDEDVSVEGLLLGRRSMESESSFRTWLDRRAGRVRASERPTTN